jgi:peptide/nickel transport system substrate-binding protein
LVCLVGIGAALFWWTQVEEPVTPDPTKSRIAPIPTTASAALSPLEAAKDGRSSARAADSTAKAAVAPAQDGDFVQAVSADATIFNPVFATGPTSLAVIDKLFPRLVGQDPHSGAITPTELALRWEISPDGRVYTFSLRDTLRWSDGQPVTAADVQFTFAALAAAQVQSPYARQSAKLEHIDAPNPTTLVVTLAAPDCAILHSLRQPLLPSHRYDAGFGDIFSNELNQSPTVSAGPFRFVEWIPGEQIVLARNPDYWKATQPTSYPIERWILRVIPDTGERWARLAAGEVDLVWLAPGERTSAPLPPDVALAETGDPGYHFLALNLADPANPQPGQNGDGAPVAQSPHPILGDTEVRQALAQAIDVDALLAAAYSGYSMRQTGYVLPTIPWAHAANLTPWSFDLAAAQARLDAAGWRDEDGDGVRAKAGRPLQLALLTNADNPQRVRLGELAAAQLVQVGIDVRFSAGTFEQATAELLGQRFDLVLIGWENLHADPGLSPFWHSRDDLPGAGYNFTSFHDPDVDRWLDEAAQFPGCDLEGRSELYRQVEQRVHEQLPYLILGGGRAAWAYNSRWQGIAPAPWSLDYNVYEWRREQDDKVTR